MSTTSRRRRQTSRRSSKRSSNEFLSIVVSCIGTYAMLLGVLPQLASGSIGLFLLGVALLVGGLHIVLAPRQGKSVSRALFEVLAVGTITFVLVYGCILLFTVYLTSQPSLMQFNLGASRSTP